MTARPRSLPLRYSYVVLVCALAAGCVTNSNPWAHVPSHAPDPVQDAAAAPRMPEAPVLARGQEIGWEIENAPLQRPGLVRSGRSVVGPDGTVEVGPYGCCPVVGLTESQAAEVLQGQLRPFFRFPRVRVRRIDTVRSVPVAEASKQEDTFVWRKAREETPAIRQVESTRAVEEVRPAGAALPAPATAEIPRPLVKPAEMRLFPLRGRMLRTAAVQQAEEGPLPQALGRVPPAASGSMVGSMAVPGLPSGPTAPGELNRMLLPPYVIGPPDVLLIDSLKGLVNQPVRGPHLVRPDGTVGLGSYGAAMVAGLTLDQARQEVARVIHSKLNAEVVTLKEVVEALTVDVLAYNSKVFYVITDGGGYGEQVVRLPVTGNETVLDAIAQINGLSPVSSKHAIWIARRTPGIGGQDNILKVDWVGITQRGSAATNYQVLPGDRIYIRADRWRTADAVLAKILSPFERILGITLLGGQTYNTITNRNNNNNNR